MVPRLSVVVTFTLAFAACGTGAGRGPATSVAATSPSRPVQLFPAVIATLQRFEASAAEIAPDRKASLERLASFIHEQRAAGGTAKLVFICTHNSRRSHMGQLWAMASAAYYGVEGIDAYSGGLEVTAFNPRAIAALERSGFQMSNPGGDNPHVKVSYATGRPAIEAFSKKYDDPFNPQKGAHPGSPWV